MNRSVLALALLLAPLLACTPTPPEDRPLDDVAVDAGPTQTLTVDDDVQGSLPSQDSGLTGKLPSNFPIDVPLPLPASITDLGGLSSNQYVEVSVPRARDAVRAEVDQLLRGNGWSKAGGDAYTSSDGRRLAVVVSGDRNGALVRIDYSGAVAAR